MFRTLLPLGAIVFAVAIIEFSNGSLQSLIPIRIALVDASPIMSGLVATGFGIGFMLGCVICPRVIRAVGHVRAYTAFAAIAAVMLLMFQIAILLPLWMALRLMMGICLAGLLTVADSWINSATPSHMRGQVLAIYATVITVAMACSQLLLRIDDVLAPTLIMIMSGLFSLAVVPISLTRAQNPPPPENVSLSLTRLYQIAPVAAVGAFVSGLLSAAIMTVTPYFFISNNVPTDILALAMMMFMIGKLLAQVPLGRLSDRIDRRQVISGCSLLLAVICLIGGIIAPGRGIGISGEAGWLVQYGVFFTLLLIGATALTQFPICMAHAHDRATGEMTLMVSSTMLFVWASGAVVGPTLCTVMMTYAGAHGIYFFIAIFAMVLAVFAMWRVTQQKSVSPEEREPFIDVPKTSVMAGALDPRNEAVDSGK